MTIDDLVRSSGRRSYAAIPEADPLREVDSLQEADLVDVRLLAGEASLALLLDLRNALQFRKANTAVLVLREVERLRWICAEPPGARRVAQYVMSTEPAVRNGLFTLEVVCLRGWYLAAAAASAEFFVGDVPLLPEVPPNFLEDEKGVISAGMPAWGSDFEPGWATFLEPLASCFS